MARKNGSLDPSEPPWRKGKPWAFHFFRFARELSKAQKRLWETYWSLDHKTEWIPKEELTESVSEALRYVYGQLRYAHQCLIRAAECLNGWFDYLRKKGHDYIDETLNWDLAVKLPEPVDFAKWLEEWDARNLQPYYSGSCPWGDVVFWWDGKDPSKIRPQNFERTEPRWPYEEAKDDEEADPKVLREKLERAEAFLWAVLPDMLHWRVAKETLKEKDPERARQYAEMYQWGLPHYQRCLQYVDTLRRRIQEFNGD